MSDVHFEPVGQVISVLTASLFAINAFHYLEGKIPEYVAFGLVLPGAALVHFFMEFILLRFPIKYRAIRRLVSRTSSIEGYWFQTVHSSEYPYSIVCIEFDPSTKEYVYHGMNYRADFRRNAMFRSSAASVDESGDNLTFHFDATVRVCPGQAGATDTAKGYGNIKFMTEGSSSFVRGIGEFFERKPEANWHTFELHRIPSAVVRKALNRRYAVDNQDYEKLLLFEINRQMEKRESSGLGDVGVHVIAPPHTEELEDKPRPGGALGSSMGDASHQQLVEPSNPT